MKFLNLLAESLLDGVRVQETLNLLFTEEELFLDHRLHVGVAINDSLQELCEVGTLGLLAVLLGPRVGVNARFFSVNRLVGILGG